MGRRGVGLRDGTQKQVRQHNDVESRNLTSLWGISRIVGCEGKNQIRRPSRRLALPNVSLRSLIDFFFFLPVAVGAPYHLFLYHRIQATRLFRPKGRISAGRRFGGKSLIFR